MKFYFAPLEGIVGYIYRNAHNAYFNTNNLIDKYFAPFIAANQSDTFKTKDLNYILPENNQGVVLIPQLLTNNAKNFIQTSKRIAQFGYTEINLNLGCPSGTVVSKKKGSGFLAFRDELDRFLDDIYTQPITDISIKTRLGKDDPEEFYALMEIYNKYPIKELIIHPRIQKDMYKNTPNLRIFKEALAISKNPVCYNGDIFTIQDYLNFTEAFPDVDTIMLGRGLLANSSLIEQIEGHGKLDKQSLRMFHDQIYQEYQNILYGEHNVLHKMKEIWFYMIQGFSNPENYEKKIRKSNRLHDYQAAVDSLFSEQEILENFGCSR